MANRYNVTLRRPDVSKDLEIIPHEMLDPLREDRLREGNGEGWYWDIAGMAIVEAGSPWTDLTRVHDFHEIPQSAWVVHTPEHVIVHIPIRGTEARTVYDVVRVYIEGPHPINPPHGQCVWVDRNSDDVRSDETVLTVSLRRGEAQALRLAAEFVIGIMMGQPVSVSNGIVGAVLVSAVERLPKSDRNGN